MPTGDQHDDVRRGHGYHLLAVCDVVQETPDASSYVFEVPGELRAAFAYRAGQFCTFRVRVGDGDAEYLRCYSMSSAPETDARLAVTVKRVPGGMVSNHFLDHVWPGDMLEVAKPSGTFCAGGGERPVIACCGGSGVTPVFSIAKSVLATSDRPVRVLYANRDRASVIFGDALEALTQTSAGRLAVHHHLDTDAGFLGADDVARFVGSDLDAEFFICGPTPFMDLVESTLHGLGVDPARIAIERFGALVASPPTSDASDKVAMPADVPETVTIILKGRRTVIAYQPGDTVLETGRRGGLTPPFSCEAGNCASCMAFLKEGTAVMRANEALSAAEVDEGWILTCQALPVGATFTVEYESL